MQTSINLSHLIALLSFTHKGSRVIDSFKYTLLKSIEVFAQYLLEITVYVIRRGDS